MAGLPGIPGPRVLTADRLQRLAKQHQAFLFDMDDARAAWPDLLAGGATQVREKRRGHVRVTPVSADVHELRRADVSLALDQRLHHRLDIHFLAVRLAAHPPQSWRTDPFEVAADQAHHAPVPAPDQPDELLRAFGSRLLDDPAPARPIVLDPALPFLVEERAPARQSR